MAHDPQKVSFHGWYVLALLVFIVLAWAPSIYDHQRTRVLTARYAPENFILVDHIDVGNSVVGEPVYLDVGREILQEFRGSYSVELRTFPRREVVCIAGDSLIYRPEANLPEVLDLEWWANDGECSGRTLPPGEFVLVTTWTIHNDVPGVPDQSLTVDSNPFTVSEIVPAQATRAIQLQGEVIERVQQLERQVESITGENE